MPRGGVRRPANPAPVSNPGSGRRTDGGAQQTPRYMPGLGYGKGGALADQEAQAPLAGADTSTKTTAAPQVSQNPPAQQAPAITKLSELQSGPDLASMRLAPSQNRTGEPLDVTDQTLNVLKALYLRDPSNQDLRRLVTAATQGLV